MEEVYKVHKVVIMPAENGTIVSVIYCDDPEKMSEYGGGYMEDSMVKKKYTADKSMLDNLLKAIGAPKEFVEVEEEEDGEEGNGEEMEVKVAFDPASFKPKKGMKKY